MGGGGGRGLYIMANYESNILQSFVGFVVILSVVLMIVSVPQAYGRHQGLTIEKKIGNPLGSWDVESLSIEQQERVIKLGDKMDMGTRRLLATDPYTTTFGT